MIDAECLLPRKSIHVKGIAGNWGGTFQVPISDPPCFAHLAKEPGAARGPATGENSWITRAGYSHNLGIDV